MSEAKDKITAPDPRITFSTCNGPREIFMSAGLVRHLAAIVGFQENLTVLYSDPTVQVILMNEAIKPKTARGGDVDGTTYETIDDLEVSLEDAKRLVEWIAGHVLSFFIDNAESVSLGMTPGQPLAKLIQLWTGLQDSAQPKQSAGASTAA